MQPLRSQYASSRDHGAWGVSGAVCGLSGRTRGSISPYPLDVIIDRDGIVRSIGRGFDIAELQDTIEDLLAE